MKQTQERGGIPVPGSRRGCVGVVRAGVTTLRAAKDGPVIYIGMVIDERVYALTPYLARHPEEFAKWGPRCGVETEEAP